MLKRVLFSASGLAARGGTATGGSLNVLDATMSTYNGISAYHHRSDGVPLCVG